MKGYILEGIGTALWKDDLAMPKAGPGEVVIKPVIVSPCTSDVHILETMAFPFMKGRALGHEAAGVVHEVGPEVKDFKTGDRVAVPSAITNWKIPEAQEGYDKYDSLSPYLNPDPRLQGCFAEYYLVKDADLNVARIPDTVTWEQAVMITDMATTAFEGVRWLNLKYGDTVVVYGIGPVGLMAVCGAALRGAGRIFGVGSRQVCFDVAREYGATDLVNYRDGDVAAQILEKNNGPVDAVIVCGGSDISAIASAMKMVRPGGTVTNVAAFMHDKEFVLPNDIWGYGCTDKTLRTVSARGGRAFMERLLALVEFGRFHPEKMATHIYRGMEHIPESLEKMGGKDRTAIKPVVFF
ncbi:MAG: alcohol dehydrogenase catalytic domain-containing protein [Spirochaetaceae bacterium]|jgi:threonine dehydrogenase-like Zn-dependent dehydrogenase|nr:alcohol dehydrogenase catalytic domain-containing protein [Spirochaetaceae bacterium]